MRCARQLRRARPPQSNLPQCLKAFSRERTCAAKERPLATVAPTTDLFIINRQSSTGEGLLTAVVESIAGTRPELRLRQSVIENRTGIRSENQIAVRIMVEIVIDRQLR
ncbi:hypothetical protein EVAR_86374_1 [Eumeta japonica]|uniref:Uncharacterized protein n=1 Tax=Eumeta variegata TaxID=151549 RepID=A0A4C1WBC7_EUMVA|nr:hypothetical protein EVAR_86374_1 [Eumeta japonica]